MIPADDSLKANVVIALKDVRALTARAAPAGTGIESRPAIATRMYAPHP